MASFQHHSGTGGHRWVKSSPATDSVSCRWTIVDMATARTPWHREYGRPDGEEARRLLDHLGIARAAVEGYSMGARSTAFLAWPIRPCRRAVLAASAPTGARHAARSDCACAEADSIDQVRTRPRARSAPLQSNQERPQRSRLHRSSLPRYRRLCRPVACPVLVAVGTMTCSVG